MVQSAPVKMHLVKTMQDIRTTSAVGEEKFLSIIKDTGSIYIF